MVHLGTTRNLCQDLSFPFLFDKLNSLNSHKTLERGALSDLFHFLGRVSLLGLESLTGSSEVCSAYFIVYHRNIISYQKKNA